MNRLEGRLAVRYYRYADRKVERYRGDGLIGVHTRTCIDIDLCVCKYVYRYVDAHVKHLHEQRTPVG